MLNITQKEIDSVLDNEVGSLGNRIKLKFSSLSNLVKHRTNIPYAASDKTVVDAPVVSPVVDKGYSLIPNDFSQIVNGESKPINVREKMINGMRGNYNLVISVTPHMPPIAPVQPQVEPVAPVSVPEEQEEKVNTDTNTNTFENNISSALVEEEDDISKMYQQVNSTRESLLNMQQEVARAESAASETEKKVQELGVEFNETEKTLQQAEARRQEIQKKIILELKNQLSTMNAEKQKYDAAIIDANQRKEDSQNKIIDFESRINDNRQKITSVNDDIAREEEKYHTLVGMSPITSEVEEQFLKRVA